MAVTLNVLNSIIFTSTLINNQRLNVNNLEPGLTMSNIVLQRMLAPPFVWRENRGTITFPVAGGAGTDYPVFVPDLWWIESQWLTDSKGTNTALQGGTAMAKVSGVRRPQALAPVYDDNNGTITFRFDALPDYSYTANVDYQRKAVLLTSYASTFGPVSDQFGYLFNKGMLSQGALLVNDSRFPIWERDFISGLLATQDGLDAQAKSIFFEQMLNGGRTATRSQGMGQQGTQARGV